ncbi:hypothetical protein CLCAR_1420 [Clostridium carboxidivorans P7]|nr:hypothetical protein CLCAR_1420 [Clostridium carboxidivorans P7]
MDKDIMKEKVESFLKKLEILIGSYMLVRIVINTLLCYLSLKHGMIGMIKC